MKVYFSGSSDDCIEIEGAHVNEFNAFERPGWIKAQTPNGDGLIVYAHYAPEGCPDGTWVLGVTLLAEDHQLPSWPITFWTAENGYSPVLIIDMPENVEISEVSP